MSKSLQKSQSLLTKSRWFFASSVLLLAGIGGITWLESQSTPSLDSSGGDQVLSARMHIQGIYAAICSYMQTNDPKALERVKEEGKEVSNIINDLNEALKHKGKMDVAANVDQAHKAMRDASVALLEAVLETSLAQREMNSASESLDATLRRITQKNGRKVDLPRGQIDLYLQQNAAFQLAQAKGQQAFDKFQHRKEALEKTLAAGEVIHHSATKGVVYPLLSVLCILFIGIFAYLRHSHTRSHIVTPLADILRCVEAASTGDTTCVPDHWAADEVGKLSQATGRLISVLSKSENLVYHLASLVESSGDAIISHNLDGKILSWNKGAQRIYGYSAEEVKGNSIDLLATNECKAEMVLNLMRLKKGEKILPFETTYMAKNGRQVQAFVRVAPIHDSTRQIIGASFISEELERAKAYPTKTSTNA